jgi:ABC-type branched-subunit amino acid transport system substrate-binding protein
MRSPSALRLALGACLLLTGCGQRLDHGTRQALLDQSLHGGAAVDPGTPVVATSGPTTGPGGPAQAGTTGGPVPAGPTGLQQSQGPRIGSSTPPGGNGGSTDVGVTATAINVGTVADQTGAQPGVFDGDIAGVRAYFAYVNSQGGVNGRTLQTTVTDSQLDCNGTTNAYSALVGKVFAFVGNLSVYDNCGVPVLKAHPKVPDVSYQLTPEHANNPSSYSSQPTVPGARTGPPLAFAKVFPEVKGAVGGLYPDVAAARTQWASEKRALQAIGFTIVYEQAVPPTEVNYTQYVIGMRQKNVKMAMLFNTAQNNAKFVNAAQQQGFRPPVIESPGTFYDPSTPAAVGTGVTDLYTDLNSSLYANADEARRIKGVATYQTWMRKTAPDQAMDYFSVFGWTQAALFVDAVRATGPRLTQSGLLTAIKGIHRADADGIIASGDPGARKPAACYLLAHYANGRWTRWQSPADGFRCDAPYHYDP